MEWKSEVYKKWHQQVTKNGEKTQKITQFVWDAKWKWHHLNLWIDCIDVYMKIYILCKNDWRVTFINVWYKVLLSVSSWTVWLPPPGIFWLPVVERHLHSFLLVFSVLGRVSPWSYPSHSPVSDTIQQITLNATRTCGKH